MRQLLETYTRPLLDLNKTAKDTFAGITINDSIVDSVFDAVVTMADAEDFWLGYSQEYIRNKIKYWLYAIVQSPEKFVARFAGINDGAVLSHVNGASHLNPSDFEWLCQNYPDKILSSIDEMYPSLGDTDGMKYNGMLNNVWIIHGTNSTNSILATGFTKGNPIGQLAYNNANDYSGDYLFGYLLDSAPNPVMSDPRYGGRLTYGTEGIVFKAATVYVNHQGDFEEQAMFDRHEPKRCFVVKYLVGTDSFGKYGNWCVLGGSKDRQKILYRNKQYRNVLDWIERNGDMYESSMIPLPPQV